MVQPVLPSKSPLAMTVVGAELVVAAAVEEVVVEVVTSTTVVEVEVT